MDSVSLLHRGFIFYVITLATSRAIDDWTVFYTGVCMGILYVYVCVGGWVSACVCACMHACVSACVGSKLQGYINRHFE